ncbi:MAG TPA: hypothetical protein PL083_03895 [Smithellaceae bacterium]|nr:hypothetical protein [Smithellaceae bacterium]
MNLFCFACRNIKNIQIGIDHQLWAVSSLSNQQAMAQRATRARNYFHPGDYGLLYCNPLHSFTTPFIVRSHADPHRIVNNVWPEAWALPFKIETLGNMSKLVSAQEAELNWSIVNRRMEAINRRGGVSAAMNMTGATVFAPVDITQEDWRQICDDLCK